MALTRLQVIDVLLGAEDDLARAREELTTAVVRRLEGWEDPEARVTEARQRVRLATGAVNAALDQALAKAL